MGEAPAVQSLMARVAQSLRGWSGVSTASVGSTVRVTALF
jgi:hypothetical protein